MGGTPRRWLTTAVLGGALTLAACSSDASTEVAPTAAPPSASTAASTGAAAADTATAPAAATTRPAATTTIKLGPARFGTLPPGAALPTDAECAAQVVATPEVRPRNTPFNQTRGRQKNLQEKWFDRVTGDYTGTTDEILQWVSCKWGIDTDIVRAQAAKESYWDMDDLGDFESSPAEPDKVCLPGHGVGADGRPNECPESTGMLQVRYQYSGPPAGRDTWPEAATSTAYHADYTYASWRACFEGEYQWLNSTDRVGEYAAGDAFGCVGIWYSGRWNTSGAPEYLADIKKYMAERVWESRNFLAQK